MQRRCSVHAHDRECLGVMFLDTEFEPNGYSGGCTVDGVDYWIDAVSDTTSDGTRTLLFRLQRIQPPHEENQ